MKKRTYVHKPFMGTPKYLEATFTYDEPKEMDGRSYNAEIIFLNQKGDVRITRKIVDKKGSQQIIFSRKIRVTPQETQEIIAEEVDYYKRPNRLILLDEDNSKRIEICNTKGSHYQYYHNKNKGCQRLFNYLTRLDNTLRIPKKLINSRKSKPNKRNFKNKKTPKNPAPTDDSNN